jgi:pyrimidine-nucleoside phosphorylase
MGISVPMISGRTLGHTGGTLDKLESIPGMDVQPSLDRFRELVASNGLAMSGQTPDLAPADRIMYSLRDATSTVTSIPLICASILSKKLAEGLDSIVFDVKVGSGAFMKTPSMAEELAGTLVRVARASGTEARALLTDMDYVLGRTAGNALEVAESLEVLGGGGPPDVRELTVALTAEMAAMSRGLPEAGPGLRAECEAGLDGGGAMERFARMVEAQGGDLEAFERLSPAPVAIEVRAERSGLWTGASALETGEAVRGLGGGRYRVDDEISPMVGWEQVQQGPCRVNAGELIGIVRADSRSSGEAAAARIAASFVWDSDRNSLIYGVL